MADGFELYHVPQQSRREKLRENLHSGSLSGSLFPVYDPLDLLTYAPPPNFHINYNAHHHHHLHHAAVKEEEEKRSADLMTSHPSFFDPQSSLQMNSPNPSGHDVTSHFQYAPQNLADVTHHGGGCGGQGLSLSLSSQQHRPYECLRYGGEPPTMADDVSCRNAAVPLGPFTGYASILKGSRFLRPAQQLMEEFCDLGKGVFVEKTSVDESLMDPDCLDGFSREGGELRGKKSMLISMLEEVLRRYKQYYHHMQAVMVSFESVAGLSNAAPYANLALKVMSKHFRTLKNAITEQLQCTDKVHGKDDAPPNGSSGDRGGGGCYGLNSGFNNEHQPVWRPQRGLPERAVVVLRAWLFEHFLHPYPTDTDKLILAKQTGLSRNQVSNWFINARVRLWKPMVEEIHMLETRQTTQKIPQRDERNDYASTDDPSTSSKRSRNEHSHLPMGGKEPMPVSCYIPSQQNLEAGGRGTGVSLTLGLSEPFPINTVRRFGLGGLDGYVMGGFEAPNNQHFGRDVMGGQLLHDFVG